MWKKCGFYPPLDHFPGETTLVCHHFFPAPGCCWRPWRGCSVAVISPDPLPGGRLPIAHAALPETALGLALRFLAIEMGMTSKPHIFSMWKPSKWIELVGSWCFFHVFSLRKRGLTTLDMLDVDLLQTTLNQRPKIVWTDLQQGSSHFTAELAGPRRIIGMRSWSRYDAVPGSHS